MDQTPIQNALQKTLAPIVEPVVEKLTDDQPPILWALAGGAALTGFAVLKRGPLGVPVFLLGAALLYRGVKGEKPKQMVAERPRHAHLTNTSDGQAPSQSIYASRSITIQRPLEDLYAFWSDPSNLPHVLGYVESVRTLENGQTAWTLKLPGGIQTTLPMKEVSAISNESITWQTASEAPMQLVSEVWFENAPAGRGTYVHLAVEFIPPAGPIGQAVLKLLGKVPRQWLAQILREFKQVMETGEKATTEGQSSARQYEVSQ